MAESTDSTSSRWLTLLGIGLTFVVSATGLWVTLHTSHQQATLQRQLTYDSLAADAPSTKVAFDSAAIDRTGQQLTLSLTVEGVGDRDGYGCHLADTEQITNGALSARQGRTQNQLTVTTGSRGDFTLTHGAQVTLTVRYQRSVDGIIQIAVAAPCATPNSTDEGVTVTVLSVDGAFVPPVKTSAAPVA
jgi:hypothetical protein